MATDIAITIVGIATGTIAVLITVGGITAVATPMSTFVIGMATASV